MSLTSGSRIGSYEIAERIGAGGMGEVYRATDTSLGRQVALKVLPDAVASDEERLARFDREAKILATLSHPNIAVIYGVERSTSTSALVMELVDGPTLADRVATGAIPIDEAIEIAKQIAAALEAAHHAGIIHRDLKPANIKLREDGIVKVLDFGLAKSLEPAGSATASASMSPTITSPALTMAGVILGTAAYMAPEQARGRRADQRADIWAFGCVLFEMLAGKRPFAADADTVSDTVAAVLKTEPDWSALPTDTPSAIRRLLRRCLAKDPRERLHDIADARLELRDSGEAEPQHEMRRARYGWAIGAVAAILLLMVSLAGVPLLRDRAVETSDVVYRVVVAPASQRFARGIALDQRGERLAFIAPGPDGRTMVWIRRLDELVGHPLSGTEGALCPFWSPDGRHLGFLVGRSMKRIDADGGPVDPVAENVNLFSIGSWNQDDVILFARGGGTIFRVSAAGGAEEPVAAPNQDVRHDGPFFLPDGRRFLFTTATVGAARTFATYVGSLDGSAPKKVRDGGTMPAYANGHLLFIEDGSLMAQPFDLDRLEVSGQARRLADGIQFGSGMQSSGMFAVSPTGVIAYQAGANDKSTLVWIDQSGRQLGAPGETGGFGFPDLSPNGRQVAVGVREDSDRARDIWVFDTERGSKRRLTDDAGDEFAPVWSHDGKQIVFSSTRSVDRDLNLYARDIDGGVRRLLERPGQDIPTSWSSDGRLILFQSQSPGADIFVLNVGDGKVTPFANTRFGEIEGQFSPDNRWVAFTSDETKRPEVYVAAFGQGASRIPVSTDGGSSPRWRPDGKELFYLRSDRTMVAVPIAATATSVELGKPRELFQTQLAGTQTPFDVTVDSRFIVLRDAEDRMTAAINLIINWPAALKQR